MTGISLQDGDDPKILNETDVARNETKKGKRTVEACFR
jgi:hypothetical protein